MTLLPEPDSPTMPSVLAPLERERQPVDGLDQAVVGREVDAAGRGRRGKRSDRTAAAVRRPARAGRRGHVTVFPIGAALPPSGSLGRARTVSRRYRSRRRQRVPSPAWPDGRVASHPVERTRHDVVSTGSAEPDPRVDHRVQDVDDEVRDDDEEGGEQGHAKDDRQVLIADRVDGELAEAVEAERRLGQDGAAEQTTEVQPEDGDDRRQRRAQGVLRRSPCVRAGPWPGRCGRSPRPWSRACWPGSAGRTGRRTGRPEQIHGRIRFCAQLERIAR